MSDASTAETERGDVPWPQRLYERPILLAVLALLFFALSYGVWGLIDIFTIPAG